MSYLHGAYGEIQAVGSRVSSETQSAIVFFGTAPVQTVLGGSANVNKPVLVKSIAEARKLFGYSDDWASYTLCEVMHVFFEIKGVGPLVFINVLDPNKTEHRTAEDTEKEVTPTLSNGKITITNAENIILDTVKVTIGEEPVEKKLNDDYYISYDSVRKAITISEAAKDKLKGDSLKVKYHEVDPSKVKADDVIGSTDDNGLNTGLYAVKNVYQATGYIPSYLAAPGFSSDLKVHEAMHVNSVKINGHWDAYMFTDLPLTKDPAGELDLNGAAVYKKEKGYTYENETISFPVVKGTDGKVYHLSTLRAANFLELLRNNDGIPYNSASNTECPIIENLYLGEKSAGRYYDESLVNEKLNANGIASACYSGGAWRIWGASSADYTQETNDNINVAETNRMMLYYISNDFQHRRSADVDKPMSRNALEAIVAQEQTRIDALVKIGALTYGEVVLNAERMTDTDIANGDFSFLFNVTTTPLAKSLTAVVNWTDQGFTTYFENLASD